MAQERMTSQPVLQPVDLAELPTIQREGIASKAVEDFLVSDADASEVTGVAKSFAASLKRHIKTSADNGVELPVRAITRQGKTYLVRTDREQTASVQSDE